MALHFVSLKREFRRTLGDAWLTEFVIGLDGAEIVDGVSTTVVTAELDDPALAIVSERSEFIVQRYRELTLLPARYI
jgi:hypothetical protein